MYEQIDINQLTLHKDTEIFPEMSQEEFFALVKDIQDNGILDPVWVVNGTEIIDGRHRFLAAKKLNLPTIPVRYCKDKEDSFKIILSANINRRHLSTSQRAMIAAKLVNTEHGGKRKEINSWPAEKSAKLFGVGVDTVRSATQLLKTDRKDLIEKVLAGKLKVNTALKSLRNSVNASEISSAPKKISQELNEEPVQEETVHKGNLYMELGKFKGTEQDVKALVHHMGVGERSIKDMLLLVLLANDALGKYKYSSVESFSYAIRSTLLD